MDEHTAQSESRRHFRELLLPGTIEWAKNIPFYQEFWPKSVVGPISELPELCELPLLDKKTYKRCFENSFRGNTAPAVVSHSTGTTGEPTFRFRGAEEVAFIGRFFGAVANKLPIPREGKRDLVLSIITGYHGARIPMPATNFVLQSGVSDDILLEQTISILQRRFTFPGVVPQVSGVIGSLSIFKLITQALQNAGVNPSQLAVHTLATTGEFVSPTWRRFLEDTWSAKLVDSYSVSEIFGGATACPKCGAFHFDAHVVPEVVDPTTLQLVDSGIGLLVLTELYPFAQIQPLIRYITEDLVRIIDSQCDPFGISIEFLGRKNFAVSTQVEGAEVILIYPTALYSILEAEPLVSRERIFTDIVRITDHDMGHPIAEVRKTDLNGHLSIVVDIAVTFQPLLHPKESEALCERVSEALIASNHELRNLIKSGTVHLDVQSSRGQRNIAPWEVESAVAE